MMLSRKHLLPVSCMALAAAAVSGCTVTTDTGPPVVVTPAESGLLTVVWTLDRSDDAGVCGYFDVADMRLLVYDEVDRLAADVSSRCEDMRVTLELPVGKYYAKAMLVDDDGARMTKSLPLESIRVTKDTELTIDIDFPARSID